MSVAVVAGFSSLERVGFARPVESPQDVAGSVDAGLGSLGSISLIAVVGCLCLALVLVLRERHHRRRLSELLDRLAKFEEVWQEAEEPADREPGVGTERGEPGSQKHFHRLPRGPLSSLISALSGSDAEQLPSPDRLDYSAVSVLQSRLDKRTTPAGLAAELNVSLRTLQRGLARTLDCTPSEFIIAVTMREAKRRLVVDGLQVQEVARSLGYDNPFYFSRRFKAYYRVAPSELSKETSS